jgi:protein SCO1/2/putative membrane protein
VQSVSITVDPEHDNTQNLLHFARQYRADPDRWWFLTGDREATYDLIRSGFLQAVAQTTEAERQQVPGIEEFEHSSRLTLLDRGNQIVGMYDARDDAQLAELVKRARELERVGSAPSWARKLPAVNATLNGSCAVLLVLGLVLIRNRKAKAHTVVMASALALSGVFLACYLTYHYQVGSVRFPGTGQARVVYFTILLSHTVLAVVMLPLIVMTVLRAVRKRFELHKRVSTIAYPIWLYVSVTGVVIYWMLYQINWAIA